MADHEVSAREGAVLLGVSLQTFYRMRGEGRLPAALSGAKRRGMRWGRADILDLRERLRLTVDVLGDADEQGELVYTVADLAGMAGTTQRYMRNVIRHLRLKPLYPKPVETLYGVDEWAAIQAAMKGKPVLREADAEFLAACRRLLFQDPSDIHPDIAEELYESWAVQGTRLRNLFANPRFQQIAEDVETPAGKGGEK